MNAVVQVEDHQLPAPVVRRGIDEASWRTAMSSLFPGAKPQSVLMVFDYCKARRLDPLKKPCHIVPIQVKQGDDYVWRDVVMPGIYEHRTTAMRTGQYMGHSKPVYGPLLEFLGVMAPEFCELTVYRWNDQSKQRTEFPVMVYFSECVATKKDYKTKTEAVNARWTKAPRQMLTKCTEAAGLREAFPDEIGGEHTAEEMEGQSYSQTEETVITRVDPRGDTSNVDWEVRDKHVSAIADIIAEFGSDEVVAAEKYRQYVEIHLQPFHEMWITVDDKLAADGIMTKAAMKKYMAKPSNRDRHA